MFRKEHPGIMYTCAHHQRPVLALLAQLNCVGTLSLTTQRSRMLPSSGVEYTLCQTSARLWK